MLFARNQTPESNLYDTSSPNVLHSTTYVRQLSTDWKRNLSWVPFINYQVPTAEM